MYIYIYIANRFIPVPDMLFHFHILSILDMIDIYIYNNPEVDRIWNVSYICPFS